VTARAVVVIETVFDDLLGLLAVAPARWLLQSFNFNCSLSVVFTEKQAAPPPPRRGHLSAPKMRSSSVEPLREDEYVKMNVPVRPACAHRAVSAPSDKIHQICNAIRRNGIQRNATYSKVARRCERGAPSMERRPSPLWPVT
jgi:hypothetical protein